VDSAQGAIAAVSSLQLILRTHTLHRTQYEPFMYELVEITVYTRECDISAY